MSYSSLKYTETVVDIDLIKPNDFNPNVIPEDKFEEFIENIRRFGVEPLYVRKKGYYYEIIDGEHRWKACKRLRIKEVPVRIVDVDDLQAISMCVRLNKVRGTIDKPKLIELAIRLARTWGLSLKEIADVFGMAYNNLRDLLWVSGRLSDYEVALAEALVRQEYKEQESKGKGTTSSKPSNQSVKQVVVKKREQPPPEVAQAFLDSKIGLRKAKLLARIKDDEVRKAALEGKLTLKDLERIYEVTKRGIGVSIEIDKHLNVETKTVTVELPVNVLRALERWREERNVEMDDAIRLIVTERLEQDGYL